VHALHQRISPAVVSVLDANGYPRISGVVIDPDGLVLTCAHHQLAPGTRIPIRLGDGTAAEGEILGRTRIESGTAADLGLLQILTPGPWPALELRTEPAARSGEIAMFLGSPALHGPNRSPLLRMGRVLAPLPDWDSLDVTVRIGPGDSGGAIVDTDGRVLGILSGQTDTYARFTPVRFLRDIREQLQTKQIPEAEYRTSQSQRPTVQTSGSAIPAPDQLDHWRQASLGTVEIRSGGQRVALGLIVSSDGWIITGYSQIACHADLTCLTPFLIRRMHFPARIVSRDPINNVALLKIEPEGPLPAPHFAQSPELTTGDLVSSPGVYPQQYAVVSAIPFEEPEDQNDFPGLAFTVFAGSNGEPVARGLANEEHPRPEYDEFQHRLQAGDVIESLNGQTTPTAEEYFRLLMEQIYSIDPATSEVNYRQRAAESHAGDVVT
ncbi:MAG: trypsin-like peptidase domain-containing protein, partial [Planctomycetaceae bacterium]|nr:trypsin-like peptidase domain-containing protein [Planctomycetaceae bacterium]